MATFNWSIKGSGGGDYTSLSLAEAGLPGSGTDTYNISYDEAFTDATPVAFFGTGQGVVVRVTVAEEFRCEGEVSGDHAELVYAVNNATNLISMNQAITTPIKIENLRIKRSGSTDTAADCIDSASSGKLHFNCCTIICDNNAGRVIREVPSNVSGAGIYTNNFIIDRNRPAGGAANDVCFFSTSPAKFYRNSVFLANNTAAGLVRTNGATGVLDCRQNLAIKAAGATATNGCYYVTSSGSFDAACDANGATDTSSPGTNQNNSLTPGSVFTTLTVGSEDLHVPSRAALEALTPGSDLSATTGSLDVDGYTIHGWYPGADSIGGGAVQQMSHMGFSFGFQF